LQSLDQGLVYFRSAVLDSGSGFMEVLVPQQSNAFHMLEPFERNLN
jgi:hypothetical protein